MFALFPETRVSVSKSRVLLFGFGDLMDTDLGATGFEKKRQNPAQKHNSVFQAPRATVNANHSLPPYCHIHQRIKQLFKGTHP